MYQGAGQEVMRYQGGGVGGHEACAGGGVMKYQGAGQEGVKPHF